MTKSLFLLFFAWLSFFLSLHAQDRGKPNLKAFKDEIKKAKAGDARSGVTLMKVCRGTMLSPDHTKDYKTAIKFYEKYVAPDKKLPAGQRGERELFEMYFSGGYGIEADLKAARKWWMIRQSTNEDLTRTYAYKANLDLKNIFDVKTQANVNDGPSQFLMGRYLLEYGIHLGQGVAHLDRAHQLRHPDAQYLKERWLLLRQHNQSHDEPERWNEALQKKTLKLASKYLNQSPLAGLEYSYIRLLDRQSPPEATELEEVMARVLAPDYDHKERRLKALTMLEKVQTGKDRILTLRQILDLANTMDKSQVSFAVNLLLEAQQIEEKLQSLDGLYQLLKEQQDIEGIAIDMPAYRNNYNGDITPLVALYKALRDPNNTAWVRPENIKKYEVEIARKIEDIFQHAKTIEQVMAIQTAMEQEPVLQKFYPAYANRFRDKLQALGADTESLDYFAEKKKLDAITFKSWDEARNRMRALMSDPNIHSLAQMRLSSYIKYKVIRDLYGENPSMRQIEQLRNTLYQQTWLSPEGDKVCFAYMRDSQNWFTGEVRRHNYTFQYTVTREDPSSKEYNLKIMYVYNGRANLAYKSTLTAEKLNNDAYAIEIYLARRKSYRWVESKSDYFKALYRDKTPSIEALAVGSLSRERRSDHGLAEQALKAKESPADFSSKTAIRTALRYFILEYVGVMDI